MINLAQIAPQSRWIKFLPQINHSLHTVRYTQTHSHTESTCYATYNMAVK